VADVISDYVGYGEFAEDIRCVLAERHDEIERGQTDLEEGPFDREAHYARKDSWTRGTSKVTGVASSGV